MLVSMTNSEGDWTEVTLAEGSTAEDGSILLHLEDATDARYVKVWQPFNEWVDEDRTPVDVAEFRNRPEELITVWYNASDRTEVYTYDEAGNRTVKQITMMGTERSE